MTRSDFLKQSKDAYDILKCAISHLHKLILLTGQKFILFFKYPLLLLVLMFLSYMKTRQYIATR